MFTGIQSDERLFVIAGTVAAVGRIAELYLGTAGVTVITTSNGLLGTFFN